MRLLQALAMMVDEYLAQEEGTPRNFPTSPLATCSPDPPAGAHPRDAPGGSLATFGGVTQGPLVERDMDLVTVDETWARRGGTEDG